jgi:hypothetical protein
MGAGWKMKYVFSVTVAVLLTAFSVQSASAQPTLTALTNADVIRLVALRVSDQTVIAVINDAKITQFDLSASAVSELTVLGVAAPVIAAMRQPSIPMPRSTPAPTPKVPVTRTTPTITELDRQKFDRVYAAGKAVDVARGVEGAPGQFQQLLFAFDVEISFVQDKVTTPAEWSLMWNYMLASAQFRLGLATYLIPGKRASDWTCCGIDRMELASTTLNEANQIYLGK